MESTEIEHIPLNSDNKSQQNSRHKQYERVGVISMVNDKSIANVSKDNSFISCSNVLWILTFCGFAIDAMVRINISLTIVDMILPREISTINKHIFQPECYNLTEMTPVVLVNDTIRKNENEVIQRSWFSFERTFMDMVGLYYDPNGFDWNEYQQGLALASFYWTYWSTQIIGGVLAKKYGTKIVFGLGIFLSTILCFLIPISSYIDIRLLMIIRMVQGVFSGVCWPSMYCIVSHWILPNERSKFFSSFQGGAVGLALFYPIFGYVISWTSWEWVYYLCGVIGIIWFGFWHYCVYDTPKQHPRISLYERYRIESGMVNITKSTLKLKTPWKSIFTSWPVWVNVIFQTGYFWGFQTYMMQAPTYFKLIHGWNIRATGFLSGFPHILKMIFALVYSMFADYLLNSNKMARRNVRILSGFLSNVAFGIFTLGVGYSGCNYIAAIVFSTLGVMVNGGLSASSFANIAELSPNFSSVVMGLAGTICCMMGFLLPFVVSIITFENQTLQQWQYVFVISGVILIVSGMIYVFFTDVKIQSWNEPLDQTNEHEVESLNGKSSNSYLPKKIEIKSND